MTEKRNGFAAALILLLGMSSVSSTDFIGESGLMLGEKVATEALGNATAGQKTLVTFWAAYNAESVIKANNIMRKVAASGEKIQVVSVSMDEFQSVYENARQKVETGSELSIRCSEGNGIASDFKVKEGEFNSFLLDERGCLVAVNPVF